MSQEVEFIEPMGDDAGADRASTLFTESFSEEPMGVWAAPGRVNLIGEHTDYNAGLCLPIALPHRTYIALAPRADTRVRVVSDINPEEIMEVDLAGLAAGDVKGWAAYPVGVAWALREMGFDQVRGFDAAFSSCVPLGSGLSSSAAMTCSTALALDDAFSLGFGSTDAGRVKLIEAAIKSENDMAGASTGGLDQNASMRCEAGHAIRLDCRPGLSAVESVTQEPVDFAAAGVELLVLDTQAPHQLNDGQYAERRSTCERAAALLGVDNLRVVADQVNGAAGSASTSNDSSEAVPSAAPTLDSVLEQLTEQARVVGGMSDEEIERMTKRVRHVITEIGRVDEFVDAFGHGDIETAGQLLDASGDSLRYDYEVTVPELDVAVDTARAEGAYGARMTGGGFGGSIIALVAAGRSKEVAQKIADAFADHGFGAPRALPVQPAAKAERIR
ncbi:galactokinase [Bifidobacterium choloepi]|uniref:Galactokinase n=1 Tax=Bifidobacterium choloepi TaxID=2614131 RepID=A0A6I5NCW9_9BIFI|nr:galactokinase [Bifidobacterium choloepi]NEG70390.1 galactokinase [Bifidobacterium choloepi]